MVIQHSKTCLVYLASGGKRLVIITKDAKEASSALSEAFKLGIKTLVDPRAPTAEELNAHPALKDDKEKA